ncbi:DoxX family protein [Pseudoxanthomonas sp. CF125]|uniref:DoxX family protein n=1 Tax=Pseudoxanthomonas sp. CF125 TaxID=1855303 RepID=UPI00088FDA28|nr:DoxX family protein [Pseudoxanthomonas sp. CF125]SDR06138.1 putative oxidoreductase [Pseudoxanthomonas sp. CF125]
MSTIVSTTSTTSSFARNGAEFVGRVLLVVLFLMSGLGKINAYDATTGYMASMGVPGVALPAVIALEVLGAVAIILGFKTRIVAALLAGFTLVTGLVFHNNFADQMQMIMFLKNVSLTGAFLMLVANGAGAFSIDAKSAK